MNTSEGPKRHRPSQRKIELDLYFLPDRLPEPLRNPVGAKGDPDALIKMARAEGHLSATSDVRQGRDISLTVCPRGEGHFMGIEMSLAEAKKLREVLDYVIDWREDAIGRAEAPPQRAKPHPEKGRPTQMKTVAEAPTVKTKAKKERS
jgi:hypothetical protein